jgi:hypothetical protein
MKRVRMILIMVSAVLCLGLAGGYFIYVRAQSSSAMSASPQMSAPPQSATNVSNMLAGPHIVFRSSALGAKYGELAAVPLGDPAGARANLGLTCERIYATSTAGACLFAKRGVLQTYGITTLDAQLRPTKNAELAGLPSRVRMSADSSLIATTTFVGGHSYAQASFRQKRSSAATEKALATSNRGRARSMAEICDRSTGTFGA